MLLKIYQPPKFILLSKRKNQVKILKESIKFKEYLINFNEWFKDYVNIGESNDFVNIYEESDFVNIKETSDYANNKKIKWLC